MSISRVRIDGPRRQDTPVTRNDRRPDPSKGVFETLLVVGGEPVELGRHLRRLSHSLDAVFAVELPPSAEEELRRAAEGISLGRLRLTVFPSRGAQLRAHEVRGGHGAHKWVDRRGMEHPDTGPGQLICDGDELLEAGWANLFAVREETLWTPPLDGRILPGTARAAVLAVAHEEDMATEELPLYAEDLLSADEVFLTNSVRGIEPAIELDGQPLPGCGPLSRRLAAALRRRWALPDAADAPPTPATAPPPGLPAH